MEILNFILCTIILVAQSLDVAGTYLNFGASLDCNSLADPNNAEKDFNLVSLL